MRYVKSPSRSKKTAHDEREDAAPWEPTLERQAKEPYGFEVEQKPGGVASHRARTAFDEHSGQFTPSEIAAAEELINDSDDATRVNVICGRTYQGMPFTGSGVHRVGHITQMQRDGHARFTWVMRHIDERFRAVLAALVLGVRAERTGKVVSTEQIAWSLEEVGQKATAWMDRSTRKGVGLGLMKAALWRVGEAYKAYLHNERQRDEAIAQLRKQHERDEANKKLDRVSREMSDGGNSR